MNHEPVFLLQGPEESEKSAYMDSIVEKIKGRTGEKPEVFRHYAFEANLVDIVALLGNGSLFARHTLVILYNAEEIKKSEEIDLLLEYISNPTDFSTLILTTHTVNQVSKKISGKIPEKRQVIFWEMFENQRKGWLSNFFFNHGIKIGNDALDLFLEMVSNNSRDIKQECNKLILLYGKGSTIGVSDLEKYLFHSREENVFTLFERVAARDFAAALFTLEKMLLSGDSDGVAIMSGLLFQAKRLLAIKLLSEKNYHSEEAYARLGIIGKKNQKTYHEAHKRYSLAEVKSMIVLFTEFDVRLRSYRSDLHRLLIQMFLYYVIEKDSSVRKPASKFYPKAP